MGVHSDSKFGISANYLFSFIYFLVTKSSPNPISLDITKSDIYDMGLIELICSDPWIGNCSCIMVHGYSLSFSHIFRSPSIALDITLAHVRPTPMPLSFTFCIDYWCFNSPKSFIMFGILSFAISSPVLIIVVWNIILSKPVYRIKDISISILPLSMLYFTAFWMRLNTIS